jgi:uncharacterized protein YndB with AHSA1/START domain
MSKPVTAHEITIRRVFDAPRELVWKAWTSPDHLARWWGARGWSTPESAIELDVRPGGTFSLTSFSDEDGTEMPLHGVYREVVEPERIVLAEEPEGNWHEGAVSVVTLTDLGDGRTEMVLRSTVNTTDEAAAQAEAGVAGAVDRLAEHLAS